ncbi:MAG: alpha/beta hydrolase [Anaerolineales bacterium]|nr:alpha/beta hydrolase [Anaerolineales bacterium]
MKLIETDLIANGLRLHVYRSGAARPPLVFAHGFTDNGLCYLPFAEQLADDFEIILYDSRGHGRSEAPRRPGTVLDRAQDLAGLVSALGLRQPGLVGHSMGAVTVALYAGLYPHLPGRIVLEDPPPFRVMASRTEAEQAARRGWRDAAAADQQKSLEALIALSRQRDPGWAEPERRPWAQARHEFHLSIFDEGPVDPDQADRIVAQITCPTLIVTAAVERGALYPPAAADQLAASLPQGRHAQVADAGHSIRRDQPAAFLQVVREFLVRER